MFNDGVPAATPPWLTGKLANSSSGGVRELIDALERHSQQFTGFPLGQALGEELPDSRAGLLCGFGRLALGLLAQHFGASQMIVYLSRQVHLDVEIVVVSGQTRHDLDKIVRHGRDVLVSQGLGRAVELWYSDEPEPAIPGHLGVEGLQLRHHPFPSTASHSLKISTARFSPISLWRGIGTTTVSSV